MIENQTCMCEQVSKEIDMAVLNTNAHIPDVSSEGIFYELIWIQGQHIHSL